MSNEIIRPQNEQLPAFMQGEEIHGDENMGDYIRPPRIKIVQAQAGEPYDQFNPGDVVLTPQCLLVAEYDKATRKGAPWLFVPVYFYPEWCTWNPLGADEPMIAERTFDPKHEIAIKAQSPDTWNEKREDGQEVRHTEHLNFIVAPLSQEFQGLQFAMSFVRGEMKSGVNLCSLIRMRNAPMFGQVFEATAGHRKNSKGNWYGIDCSIPKTAPLFVDNEDLYKSLKMLHLKFKDAHEKQGGIQVDYEDIKADSAANETEF